MKLFSETEAWILFKFTAISEAFGWTLLLYGIAAVHYHLPGQVFMLPIGGSIHGILFLAYLGVVIAGFPSLGWSLRKAVLGVFLSVVPFATLVFESLEARKRNRRALQSFRRIRVCAIVTSNHAVLALQPSSSVSWQLPSGYVTTLETPSVAVIRMLSELAGIQAQIATLKFISHVVVQGQAELVFYFLVKEHPNLDASDIHKIVSGQMAIDAVKYIVPRETLEFEPAFLRNESLQAISANDTFMGLR
jgi:integral membrane protein